MDRRIKLATVVGKMKGGGVESIVMEYMRQLDREKFELWLLVDSDSTLVPEHELSDLGVRLIWVPPYQKVAAYHKALYRLFREEKFDIVHAHINTLNVFPLFAAWRAGIPVRIAHNHNTLGKGETKRNIAKYLLRPFAKVFPTTLCACGSYAGRWIYGSRAPFFVMPNSIDFREDEYRFAAEVRTAAREELGLTDRFVIGHVGRFLTQKNHKFLVEVFAKIVEKEPKATLLLVGSGELLPEVKARVKELGIEDRVIFTGQRGDTARLYQAMDVFVFPSLYEGKPLVPMEAQLSGLPVLSADTVTREIIYDDSLVEFLPLTASAEVWADKALEMGRRAVNRQDVDVKSSRSVSAGNERYVSADELGDWYRGLVKEPAIRESMN